MRQIQDEDLILYYYGEAGDAEEIRDLLAGSPELSARYDALCRTLDAVGDAVRVPERPESYGAEVWKRLEPRLSERTPLPFPPRWSAQWGWLAAAVLLLAVGFLAGRLLPRPGGEEALTADARERILTRTMAAHLERSERLLTELANAETGGSVDISAERRWAQDLLTANRLYRQITRRGGRPMLSSLLDDLEPFLLELAHSPSEIPEEDLADLRARLEEQALLFKMRVVSQRLERKPSL
jgi:hypothetical protein